MTTSSTTITLQSRLLHHPITAAVSRDARSCHRRLHSASTSTLAGVTVAEQSSLCAQVAVGQGVAVAIVVVVAVAAAAEEAVAAVVGGEVVAVARAMVREGGGCWTGSERQRRRSNTMRSLQESTLTTQNRTMRELQSTPNTQNHFVLNHSPCWEETLHRKLASETWTARIPKPFSIR